MTHVNRRSRGCPAARGIVGRMRARRTAAGGAAPVNLEHIKGPDDQSHRTINPIGVVPVGPDVLPF